MKFKKLNWNGNYVETELGSFRIYEEGDKWYALFSETLQHQSPTSFL